MNEHLLILHVRVLQLQPLLLHVLAWLIVDLLYLVVCRLPVLVVVLLDHHLLDLGGWNLLDHLLVLLLWHLLYHIYDLRRLLITLTWLLGHLLTHVLLTHMLLAHELFLFLLLRHELVTLHGLIILLHLHLKRLRHVICLGFRLSKGPDVLRRINLNILIILPVPHRKFIWNEVPRILWVRLTSVLLQLQWLLRLPELLN
jgi:hypothetical protein